MYSNKQEAPNGETGLVRGATSVVRSEQISENLKENTVGQAHTIVNKTSGTGKGSTLYILTSQVEVSGAGRGSQQHTAKTSQLAADSVYHQRSRGKKLAVLRACASGRCDVYAYGGRR